ncbi:MAG: hypothetical protein IJV41_08140 [Oscillospiraceae bacterium]|nr:hypothetical protein [Oscillospiraceae bacterium]
MNHDFQRELRRFEDVWRRVEDDARHAHGHRPPPPPPPPPPKREPCCHAVRFNPHGRYRT